MIVDKITQKRPVGAAKKIYHEKISKIGIGKKIKLILGPKKVEDPVSP